MILAIDAPGKAELREKHRHGHVSHFKAHADRIALAGPFTGDRAGSLVIFRCETVGEAQAFIRADPFYDAGVWGRIEIEPFRASIVNLAA